MPKKKNRKRKPVVLMILDGWGEGKKYPGNAVKLARTPFFDALKKDFPWSRVETCCEHVGLPKGLMGNSEVGHMNMGAGRVVEQELVVINNAIKSGVFFQNATLLASIQHAKSQRSTLHLVGILSDGRVHGDIKHLFALLKLCKRQGLKKVSIHAITDGRDVPPKSALKYIKALKRKIKTYGVGKIATVSGRYYAMDRAHHYDRTKKVYDAIVAGKGLHAKSAEEAVSSAYAKGLNDYNLIPTVVGDPKKKELLVDDGDAFIFYNLRSDRTRQLTKPFVLPTFDFFRRNIRVNNLYFTGMTSFGDDLPMSIAFPSAHVHNSIPDYLEEMKNIRHMYIAEEEKFAPVAFFFHGGRAILAKNEKRVMIKSLDVKSYALAPEMSAKKITKKVLDSMKNKHFPDLTVMNYANPDMLGHTGNIPAAVKSLEFLDKEIKKIVRKVIKKKGDVLITADHGNIEEMLYSDGSPQTKHSTNPVPAILVQSRKTYKEMKNGILGDVAPTILKLMKLEKPAEMTGESLIK